MNAKCKIIFIYSYEKRDVHWSFVLWDWFDFAFAFVFVFSFAKEQTKAEKYVDDNLQVGNPYRNISNSRRIVIYRCLHQNRRKKK